MTDPWDEVLLARAQERLGRVTGLTKRHPHLRGIAAPLALGLLGIVHLLPHRAQPLPLVFWAALCGALLLRRRGSLLCFGAVATILLIQWFLSAPQAADAAILIALYWVALEGPLRTVAVAAATVEVGAVMAALHWGSRAQLQVWVGLSGLTVAATVLGIMIRQRRALLHSMLEEARRLVLERDREGQLAAAAERARIAREMHDIVSHNLTVMIALADGAGYAMQSAPDQALPAIERVSATGRQALVEMRRLLGVLRDEPQDNPLEPQPGLDRLDDLLARVNAAGIPVTVDVDGDPRQLAEGVQVTVFRVAQEALTNALKHAVRPASAHVTLRCGSGDVQLDVTNTGCAPPTTRSPGVSGGGRGLRGMRERASAYGGELDAGPTAGGGWQVRLRLHGMV